MVEFCHNIKPFIQPQPLKNHSGDCFACAFTAALQHLFPEKPPEFERVWNYFMAETYGGGQALSNTWPGFQKAFVHALRDGYKIEYQTDIVLPQFKLDWWSYAYHYPFINAKDFTYRLEGWLRSGWIAVQEINMNGITDNYAQKATSDHFVLVDGIKYGWEPTASGNSSTVKYYVHVVCSAKGEYWIDTDSFMRKHGACAWLLVRKDIRS